MSVAGSERQQLCALFEEVGPDAPTLCGEWRTRELAAHLVLRERRPDAALGVLFSPLAGHTQRVQDRLGTEHWARLVEQVSLGPPRWSPFVLPLLNERVNAFEYLVHHEDVRRAKPDWQPRPAEPARDRLVWRLLRSMGRLLYRNSPVGVRLRRLDGSEMLVKAGSPEVTIIGDPVELVLHAYGRDQVQVGFEGDPAEIAKLEHADRGV